MERLHLLSQDKPTLHELKEFMLKSLEAKLVKKALANEDITGYSQAHDIIKHAMDEVDKLHKLEKKPLNLNQSQ